MTEFIDILEEILDQNLSTEDRDLANYYLGYVHGLVSCGCDPDVAFLKDLEAFITKHRGGLND